MGKNTFKITKISEYYQLLPKKDVARP
jgi:hypothetical protein